MRLKLTGVVVLACAVPLLAACGPKATTNSASTPSTESTSQPTIPAISSSTSAAAAPTTSLAPSSAAAGVSFAMPNEVGKVLQDAQNDLHSDGVFYSRSHDMLGTRHQVLDRDWKVCNQNVPAGQQVTGNAEGMIDFGVVKLSEKCP